MGEEMVYAYLLENAMEEEDMDIEGILFFLEVYKKNDIKRDEQFLPDGYTLVVTEGNQEICESIKSKCRRNHGWVKGVVYEPRDNNYRHGVLGHIMSYGEDTENKKMVFVPIDMQSEDSDTMSVIKDKEAASEDDWNQVTGDLPDDLLEDDNDDNGDDNNNNDDNNDEADDEGDNDTAYKVTVYKVGHGNAITIEKGGRCILFDCGTRFSPTTYQTTINHIRTNIKPDVIIFSHWHWDHYSLFNGKNNVTVIDCSRTKLIICPGKPPQDVETRLRNLKNAGVYIIDFFKNNNQDLLRRIGYDNIDIFKGLGIPGPQSYASNDHQINDTGIMLSILTSYTNGTYRALLPGDCSYASWPHHDNEMNLQNAYRLVVPHHSAPIAYSTFNNGPKMKHIPTYIISSKQNTFYNNIHKDYLDREIMLLTRNPQMHRLPKYLFTENCSSTTGTPIRNWRVQSDDKSIFFRF
ncbi:MAG: MBL fold metallo-hydrolase [Lachnospiraceae bacterium]|nr:MBL fold metallo-hydrolase [Lachnospiraceae bacterium]